MKRKNMEGIPATGRRDNGMHHAEKVAAMVISLVITGIICGTLFTCQMAADARKWRAAGQTAGIELEFSDNLAELETVEHMYE